MLLVTNKSVGTDFGEETLRVSTVVSLLTVRAGGEIVGHHQVYIY